MGAADCFKVSQVQSNSAASQTHLFNMSQIDYPTGFAPRGNDFTEYVAKNGSKMKVFDPYRYMEDT